EASGGAGSVAPHPPPDWRSLRLERFQPGLERVDSHPVSDWPSRCRATTTELGTGGRAVPTAPRTLRHVPPPKTPGTDGESLNRQLLAIPSMSADVPRGS